VPADGQPRGGVLLRAESLTKRLGGRDILAGVTVEVRGGEVVGLLGPNGAGKTTTFYCVVGLLRPDGGTVSLNGVDVTREPMYRRARIGIAYLAQEPSVFRRLSVEDNLLAILETLPLSHEERNERLNSLLEDLSIAHLAKSPAYTLSGGERRRVEISRALVTSPTFMLLDEPFAGIDPIAVLDIGILITDHNVRETLGICDRAYILSGGVILEEGTPEVIAASRRARELYLGEGFSL